MAKRAVTAQLQQSGTVWTLHMGDHIHVLSHPRQAATVAPTVAAYVYGGLASQYAVTITAALPESIAHRWEALKELETAISAQQVEATRERAAIVAALSQAGIKPPAAAAMLGISAATARRWQRNI